MNWEIIVLPALIGAFVAMIFNLFKKIGDQVIARFFDRSSRREAERDGDLIELRTVIFEVRDLSVRYWLAESDKIQDIAVPASIVGRLVFLNSIIEDLYSSNPHFAREMTHLINRFDISCTAGNFRIAKKSPEPERCRDIEITAYQLVHKANYFRRRL